jgi:hypothetical protein
MVEVRIAAYDGEANCLTELVGRPLSEVEAESSLHWMLDRSRDVGVVLGVPTDIDMVWVSADEYDLRWQAPTRPNLRLVHGSG